MKIVFGMDADRGAWPPTTDGCASQAGGLVVGPLGLLSVLEAATGYGGPLQPQAVRIARWRAKLAAADAPGRFWHASLAVDPFTTAKTVLAMRDALVEAGWHWEALEHPPQRLCDLAAAEAAGPALPAGVPDRLRSIIHAFERELPPEPPVATLMLLDPRPLLPPGIGELVSALEASGTRVTEAPAPNVSAPGDLGVVQSRLSGRSVGTLSGDSKFTLLRANTEGAAAEVLADWLSAHNRRDDIVIVATRPTGVLDAALRRRHLPRLGISASSSLRGLVQILPLALATRWQPFDAVRLLELLQMRHSPIPREVSARLLSVLPECPGRGSMEWREAIAMGLLAREERLRVESPDTADATMRTATNAVDLWLNGPLAEPETGIAIKDLAAMCSALTAWSARMAVQDVPLAAGLYQYTAALLLAAQETGLERIPRLELERILDTVLADGHQDPSAPKEASEWAVVESPGAVWGSARTLVWWGFDAPPVPARSPWDDTEVNALVSVLCAPWAPASELSVASTAWRRPLLEATESAMLVSIAGTNAEPHPLAHELAVLLDPMPSCCPSAEELIASPHPVLAGHILPRVPVAFTSLPIPRVDWSIPPGLEMRRERHSATSVEQLLGCPFAWVLNGSARIHPGRRAEIADGERLIGLVAHRLAAELFPPGAPGLPMAIKAAAGARLKTLIEEAGAPLLQRGAAADRVRLLEQLPVAMEKIAELLVSSNLTVVAAEVSRDAANMPDPAESFTSRIDLLLENEALQPVVLDLKWTRKGSQYRDRLEQGHAIQLAAYAKIVGAGERAAYFLLRDGEAFSTPGAGIGTCVRAGAPTLDDTWEETRTSRRLRMGTIRLGVLRALGIDYDPKKPPPDPDGATIRPTPPCTFCEFGRLCGVEQIV